MHATDIMNVRAFNEDSKIFGQEPFCIWLTGLSGAGKSTIANQLNRLLHNSGYFSIVIDGDDVRKGLNRDLGFSDMDRSENVRRVGELAKIVVDAGLIAIVSLISPFESDRKLVRKLFEQGSFVEVFVDTPFDECEKRDVKGLYGKARKGEIEHFTGLSSLYERPSNPEVHLVTLGKSIESCLDELLQSIQHAHLIGAGL